MTIATTVPRLIEATNHEEGESRLAKCGARGSLMVFSDDWGRHPSSCQHLISRLTSDYQVLWVNTIGTRAPKLDLATFRRATGKLLPRRSVAKNIESAESASQVRVVNPLMWPWFRRPLDREFNRRLLVRALKKSIASLPRPVHAVTTIPLVADLVGELDVARWVYYCVDDLAAWPGLDREPLESMERKLVAQVDAAVTVSPYLQNRLRGMGRDSTVISHGVDQGHWEAPTPAPLSSAALLAMPCPWIVFWGLIDERLDGDWLLRTADALKTGTIILAGPVVTIDSRLRNHPRVFLPGPLTYQELPSLARQASVLTMPYRRMPATEAMQPLKLKEYMATGRPCVVTQLPATEPWQDCVDVASSSDQFTDLVLTRLERELPASQREARLRLASESWDAKARQFEAVLQATLAAPTSNSSI